jgi:hypothetical protein
VRRRAEGRVTEVGPRVLSGREKRPSQAYTTGGQARNLRLIAMRINSTLKLKYAILGMHRALIHSTSLAQLATGGRCGVPLFFNKLFVIQCPHKLMHGCMDENDMNATDVLGLCCFGQVIFSCVVTSSWPWASSDGVSAFFECGPRRAGMLLSLAQGGLSSCDPSVVKGTLAGIYRGLSLLERDT